MVMSILEYAVKKGLKIVCEKYINLFTATRDERCDSSGGAPTRRG